MKWRFKYNPDKTQCMLTAPRKKAYFLHPPSIYADSKRLDVKNTIDILGCTFNGTGFHSDHVQNRIDKCRRSFYMHKSAGLSFPGLPPNCKAHIWNTACQPVLLYGASPLNCNVTKLNTNQSLSIKQFCGLFKTNHSTHLLRALHIVNLEDRVYDFRCSLFKRIFNYNSIVYKLNKQLLLLHYNKNRHFNGTLMNALFSKNANLLHLLQKQNVNVKKTHTIQQCGLTDSIKSLLVSQSPNSIEHKLLHLLTKSF